MLENLNLQELFQKELNKVCMFVKNNMDLRNNDTKKSQDYLFHLKNMFYINVNFNIQNNKEYYKINEIRKDLIKEIGYYYYIQIEKNIFDSYYEQISNK